MACWPYALECYRPVGKMARGMVFILAGVAFSKNRGVELHNESWEGPNV